MMHFIAIFNIGLFVVLSCLAGLIICQDKKGKFSWLLGLFFLGFGFDALVEIPLCIMRSPEILGYPAPYWHVTRNVIRGSIPYGLFFYLAYFYVRDRSGNIKLDYILSAIFTGEAQIGHRLRQAEDNVLLLQRYLRIISHELKTPVTTMANFADLAVILLEKCEEERSSEYKKLKKYLHTIISSAEVLVDLINDLVDYNLSVREAVSKPTRFLSLQKIIEDGIYLSDTDKYVDIQDPFPIIYGGEDLVRVFINIFSNAQRYRSTHPLKIDISFERGRNSINISVRDNGIGFDPKKRELIFDMFKSAHGTNGHSEKGSGMGLAIAKGIVRRYSGDVWAESEGENRGAIFHLRFPLVVRSNKGERCLYIHQSKT